MSGRIRKEDLHDTLLNQVIPFAVATGLKNVYSISTSPAPIALVAGMAVSVQINVASDAASTLNWNGLGAVGIKKANGTDVTNLKLNGIYTLRYDGVNFMLQGEGAGGNAIAAHLLAGETASTDAGDIVGTMVNHTGYTDAIGMYAQTADPGTLYAWIPYGAYLTDSGSGSNSPGITLRDPDFTPPNWLTTVNIFGLQGTMPENGALTITPSTAIQTFGTGHYSGITVQAYPVTAGNIILANIGTDSYAQSTTMTKVREFKLNYSGGYRISFNLYTSGPATATAQLYRNGVAIGTLRSTTSQTAVAYTEDISGWNTNDLLQLYCSISNVSYGAHENNFSVGIYSPAVPTQNL
jgi:hypothetical protein